MNWSLRLIAAVSIGLAVAFSAPIPDDADFQDEIAFFHRYDANTDGFHSKKEFYYAIMEDDFEALASKYDKNAVDMEFEYADLNGDKKISLDEWKGVFFHEQPQEATYVDGELQDVSNAPEEVPAASAPAPSPPAPSPPPSPAASTGVSAGKVQKKMHIGSEVTLQTGHKAYLSEDATWYETNDFCKEAGVRLCTEDELCNRRTGMHIMDDQNLTEDDRFNRWAPLHGSEHVWLELRNCGLTRWPDTIQHPGIIVCCSNEKAKVPQTSTHSAQEQDGERAPAAQEGEIASDKTGGGEAPAGVKDDGESVDTAESSGSTEALQEEVVSGSAETHETVSGSPADAMKEDASAQEPLKVEESEKLSGGGSEDATDAPVAEDSEDEIKVEKVSKSAKKSKGKGKGKAKGKKIKPPKVA